MKTIIDFLKDLYFNYFQSFIKDFLFGFVKKLVPDLLEIILYITVILVVLEVLKAIGILDIINEGLSSLTKHLGISKSASMPLLIGILAGITYGAGAILASYANKEMTRKDVILVSVFLCICHGIVEDTILFVREGANGLIILLIRFSLAILTTIIANYFLKNKKEINKE